MPSDSLERDDDRFVEAAIDPPKAEQQIQLLSKARRTFYKISIFQIVLTTITFFIKLMEELTSTGRSSYLLLISLALGCAFYMSMFFHIDLKIKFLKATLADRQRAT